MIMAVGHDYTKIIPLYEHFVKKLGYTVSYNGTKPDDSEVFMVLYIPNPDNSKEFSMAFYHVYTDAPLSMEGFIKRVMNEGKQDEYAQMMTNRIKGCTVTKTDIVYILLETDKYTIDDIYGDGYLHLTPSMMHEVADSVNFKGGRRAITREQAAAMVNNKAGAINIGG